MYFYASSTNRTVEMRVRSMQLLNHIGSYLSRLSTVIQRTLINTNEADLGCKHDWSTASRMTSTPSTGVVSPSAASQVLLKTLLYERSSNRTEIERMKLLATPTICRTVSKSRRRPTEPTSPNPRGDAVAQKSHYTASPKDLSIHISRRREEVVQRQSGRS
ncbi:hypothetical protein BDN70DRAFT_872115 [Pholiota conissans]|uniref:Uncharacterized protein n=1 Tax=Pholiota conissans TaxID=109636 RepID=A0A9P5ZDU6_9AGAR|nr:hypothetical protein BDN70DRAFT_872115 [Pholiota conissans]